MAEKKYQPGEWYNYQLLIKHILETPLLFAPDQQIIYRDKVRLTYRAFNERVHRLANALKLLGVKTGDTVCVFDYDSHRYLECFFAIPMMGAVLHTQNWRLSPEQLLYTMNHAEDDVVLIHADFLPLLETIQDKLTTVKKIILITDDDKKPETKVRIDMEYEEMLQGTAPSYDFPDLDEKTRATTFYTTGTTGLPKGVYFSHRQLVLHTLSGLIGLSAYESPGRFRSNDVYMPITPMFHVHAWGIPYAATMLGVKQVYPGKYEPEMLLKLILTEKVTFSHCVPTIIHMLVTSPAAKKLDLSKWKVVIGGARLPKGLAKAAEGLGIQVFSGYGMSETCPIISLANLKPYMLDWNEDKQIDKQIMTGLPVPLVYTKVVDSSGKELPHNGQSTGELILRAPWLTESYFKDPERTKDLWQNGWLHTGDVAFIDPAGYIQITDRTKDVIKTGGEWISSLELENLISQHEAVSEAAAIGIPDNKWGERPLLIVVLRPEYRDKVSEEDLHKFMTKFAKAGKIPKYGVPDRYQIVDAIPKTSVGKINKIQLRKLYI
jgi:fatty-acyl-CoA synthase